MRMNIEDKIIEIENSADQIINDAIARSKIIMESFKDKSREISREIGLRFKQEKEKIDKEYQGHLKIELDKIKKLEEDELLRIKEIARKKTPEISRKIVKMITEV